MMRNSECHGKEEYQPGYAAVPMDLQIDLAAYLEYADKGAATYYLAIDGEEARAKGVVEGSYELIEDDEYELRRHKIIFI